MIATFHLSQVYQAAPVIWGSLQDTTGLAYVYQAAPFVTKNESGSATYTYDSLGRLTGVSFLGGGSVTYNYDTAGNRTSVVNA